MTTDKTSSRLRLSLVDIDERMGLPSASAMDRLVNCPASWLLSKHAPPPASTKYAEAGTRIHEALEKGDTSELTSNEADITVQINQMEKAVYDAWVEEFNITDAVVTREQRLILKDNGAPIFTVKIDFYAYSPSQLRALILDAKSGRKDVQPPVTNWQLRSGAVSLFSQLNLVHARVGIVQPFARKQPLCDYEASDLITGWEFLKQALDEIHKPNLKPFPGDYCDYCPCKSICEPAKGYVKYFSGLKSLAWSSVTPAQKLTMWDMCSVATKVIEDVKKNIRFDLKTDPKSVPGLVKGEDGDSRSISNPNGVYMVLSSEIKEFTVNDFSNLVSLPMGKLTDYVREAQGCTKDEAEDFINTKCAEFIEKNPRAGSIRRVK